MEIASKMPPKWVFHELQVDCFFKTLLQVDLSRMKLLASQTTVFLAKSVCFRVFGFRIQDYIFSATELLEDSFRLRHFHNRLSKVPENGWSLFCLSNIKEKRIASILMSWVLPVAIAPFISILFYDPVQVPFTRSFMIGPFPPRQKYVGSEVLRHT